MTVNKEPTKVIKKPFKKQLAHLRRTGDYPAQVTKKTFKEQPAHLRRTGDYPA